MLSDRQARGRCPQVGVALLTSPKCADINPWHFECGGRAREGWRLRAQVQHHRLHLPLIPSLLPGLPTAPGGGPDGELLFFSLMRLWGCGPLGMDGGAARGLPWEHSAQTGAQSLGGLYKKECSEVPRVHSSKCSQGWEKRGHTAESKQSKWGPGRVQQ